MATVRHRCFPLSIQKNPVNVPGTEWGVKFCQGECWIIMELTCTISEG